MLEFPSEEFFNSCKEEIEKSGFCYLKESLSGCAGAIIEYFIECEEELKLLKVNNKSIWTILISETSPIIHKKKEMFIKEETIDLSRMTATIIDENWLNKAKIKLEALVYTNGQPIKGAY